MAALGSQTIASSYEQLLHVDADGGGNGNTLVSVKDGDNGTTFGLKLSTNKVEVIPSAADDANAFEVSKNDGTAVLTVNTSTVGATLIGALTVGADDAGHDVIFYGDTASSNMTWDTSEDDLVLNDATLSIDQDDNAIGISVDGEQTTANGIDARFDALTTGKGLYVYSDSSSNGTRQLVQFENDNTGATGTTVLKLRNDADSYGMLIDQNGNSQALRIDSESTTDNVISILSESTTGNVIYADCDTLTTGSLIKVESNSSTTDTRNLVQVINDHASATGATCLFVDQDANQKALLIDSESTTINVLTVEADALTTGYAGYFYSNSSSTSTRNVLEVQNDHASATGTTALMVKQDAANQALKIDQNGNGDGLVVSTDATTRHGVYVDGSSFTTGSALKVYSNSSSTSSRNLAEITNDNVNASAATCLKIQQDASYYGIDIDHNNNSTALNIDATATTENVVSIVGHSLTTGGLFKMRSDTGNTSSRKLAYIINDHADATATIALEVKQDSTDKAVKIDQDGNGTALYIDTEATGGGHGVHIAAPAFTTGTAFLCDDANSLTTGRLLNLSSDSNSGSARYLAFIHNNHVDADSCVPFGVQHDSNNEVMKIIAQKSDFTGQMVLINAEGRSSNSGFDLLRTYTDGDNDVQHRLRGDGALIADAAYDGSGADYAEYFESKDNKEIAVGTTVKLDGDKVVACEDGDTPIGVVRPNGNSVVVGNSATLKWTGKYLKDDYGAYIMEEYTTTFWIEETDEIKQEAVEARDAVLYTEGDEIPEGKKVGDIKEEAVEAKAAVYKTKDVQYNTDEIPSDVTVPSDARVTSKEEDGSKFMRRKKNPDYDESKTYVPREERDEWCLIGLLGQIPITKGQPVASNWIKMKDVSDTVEMYFVK